MLLMIAWRFGGCASRPTTKGCKFPYKPGRDHSWSWDTHAADHVDDCGVQKRMAGWETLTAHRNRSVDEALDWVVPPEFCMKYSTSGRVSPRQLSSPEILVSESRWPLPVSASQDIDGAFEPV